MPGIDRRVRFSVADSPRSTMATPSPTFSDSSLPSEGGPHTPPMGGLALTPPGSVLVHGALAFHPGNALPLVYDVSTSPATVAPNPKFGVPPGHLRTVLAEPATSPPLPALTIVTDLLPYALTVHPGSVVGAASPYATHLRPLPSAAPPGARRPPVAPACVSVADVLNALYAMLRLPVSAAEVAAIPRARAAGVAAAYHARVARVLEPQAREAERRKGVKRVDLLLAAGKTRLAGLSATKRAQNVFVLNLG